MNSLYFLWYRWILILTFYFRLRPTLCLCYPAVLVNLNLDDWALAAYFHFTYPAPVKVSVSAYIFLEFLIPHGFFRLLRNPLAEKNGTSDRIHLMHCRLPRLHFWLRLNNPAHIAGVVFCCCCVHVFSWRCQYHGYHYMEAWKIGLAYLQSSLFCFKMWMSCNYI